MEGTKSETDVVTVEVFRKTRYTQLSKMKNKKAKTKKEHSRKKVKNDTIFVTSPKTDSKKCDQ